MSEHQDTFRSKASDDNYRSKHEAIFGKKEKAETGTYVMVDGKLVLKEEAPAQSGVTVISDIAEGYSPITGERIDGRLAMREHCKRHNTYYTGR